MNARAEGRLLRARHHRHRVEDRPVRLLARAERLLDAVGPHGGVGRVDEAGFDLAPRHVLERLADVLGEDELRLETVPEPEGAQALLRVLAHRHRLRVPDHDAADAAVEQVLGLGQVEPRVGRLDDGEDVAREDASGVPDDQTPSGRARPSAAARPTRRGRSGAPASICFWSSPDDPKLYRSWTPGCRAAKPRPSSSTASFMLIATDSVTSWALAAGTGPRSTARASPASPAVLVSACASPFAFRGSVRVLYDPPMPRPTVPAPAAASNGSARHTGRPPQDASLARGGRPLRPRGRRDPAPARGPSPGLTGRGSAAHRLVLSSRLGISPAGGGGPRGPPYRHPARERSGARHGPDGARRPDREPPPRRAPDHRRRPRGPSGPAPEEIAARGGLSRRPAPPAGRRSARTGAARTSRRRRS